MKPSTITLITWAAIAAACVAIWVGAAAVVTVLVP